MNLHSMIYILYHLDPATIKSRNEMLQNIFYVSKRDETIFNNLEATS